MPKVPEFNKQPIKLQYFIANPDDKASFKQKNYILTMCERRKIPTPEMKELTKSQAAQLISNMRNK